MKTSCPTSILEIGGRPFATLRPHRFGLIILGDLESLENDSKNGLDKDNLHDYLHKFLLAEPNRESFFQLIDCEQLVVCKNVRSEAPTYRKVRGKSSMGRLSQAEYYHHDGCSSPVKPRFNEIRLPYQSIDRNVATAIAPFGDVVRAQLQAMPDRLLVDELAAQYRDAFATDATRPPVESWDRIQGHVTRLVRRDMDAEAARQYFREVDRLAGAYDLPWEMGESRLMLNNHSDLTRTVQHRRAFQKPKMVNDQNGRLVKRWTAEEIE